MSSGANTLWGRALVDEVARSGVKHVCIAPGSRSTPLVLAADAHPDLRCWTHLDERSAGFFALGIGKASGLPAAVITTSGTAGANLFPAVVEAAQAETPLLVLTADRPHRLRGADANQAIDQVGLYGRYPRAFFEIAPPTLDAGALRHLRQQACRAVAEARGLPGGPVHVNVPFRKPLEPPSADQQSPEASGGLAEEDPVAAGGRPGGEPYTRIGLRRPRASAEEVEGFAALLQGVSRGLVVAGPCPEPRRTGSAAVVLARATGFPLLPDPLSGARWGPAEGVRRLAAYDLLLREEGIHPDLEPQLVVRVGRTPTSAALARFLQATGALQVVVDPGEPWKDHLAVAHRALRVDAADLLLRAAASLDGDRTGDTEWLERWIGADAAAREAALEAASGKMFEGTVLAEAVALAPEGGRFFVGSSMPVRDLDAFGEARSAPLLVLGNRGASGIDGSVSCALGMAVDADEPVVAVLGDLAFYHDMNGLMAARSFELPAVFVVIHNDGGGIFHMLPVRELEPAFTRRFATPHGLDFRHAAALYGIPYERLGDGGDAPEAGPGPDSGPEGEPTDRPDPGARATDPSRFREAFRRALEGARTDRKSRILVVPSHRDRNRVRHEEVEEAVREALRGL